MHARLGVFARNLVGLTLAATGLATSLIGAEPSQLRLAVGPFFAPAPNDQLRQVAARLPDMLAVELSQQNRFQLVERDKVTAVWQELNLKARGLTTPQAVSDLGRILACDWLVTGALVPTTVRTQVWTKIIDIKTSVVLDIQGLPFDVNNLPAALTNIAGFLAHAGAQPQAQRFLTLGRFTDLSNSPGHEDWSRRVAALIEQDCRANGIGLVEREAVGPIFEEFQFDQANLTGSPTPRVKLQSAFWIVDGACSWVRDPDDKVNVALRIQRVAGQEQTLSITKHPGPELESSVLSAIRGILAQTNATNPQSMGLQESRLHTARGMLSAENNDSFSPSHHFASSLSWTNADRMKHFQDNRRATLDSFERAMVLDPKNIRAKLMLGDGLLSDEDPAQRERGKELLREVASSEDATAAKHASYVLSNADLYLPHPAPYPVGTALPRAAAPPRVAQKSSGNDKASIEKRNEFLQQNFSSFVSLPFQPATNSEAAIQYLRVKENLFEYEGDYYCGFQFTVPEWIDGDFAWIYLFAKTETNKDFSIRGPRWYILPKTGQSKGFDDFDSKSVASYPHLKERFPYTHVVTVQDLAQDRLEPGKTYGIWFSFKIREVADLAIAMTIRSDRGKREFGVLPLK